MTTWGATVAGAANRRKLNKDFKGSLRVAIMAELLQ